MVGGDTNHMAGEYKGEPGEGPTSRGVEIIH